MSYANGFFRAKSYCTKLILPCTKLVQFDGNAQCWRNTLLVIPHRIAQYVNDRKIKLETLLAKISTEQGKEVSYA
ncbi:hypothetical protein JCM19238_411 [Vibrio ponticus]|nr:hypothetical protein JCM19238_411 [Vibrio ponticus]